MKLHLEKITIRQFMDALQEELAGYDPDKTYIHFEVLSEVAVNSIQNSASKMYSTPQTRTTIKKLLHQAK